MTMTMLRCGWLGMGLFLCLLVATGEAAEPEERGLLSQADEVLLRELLQELDLVDPRGAKRVRAPYTVRNVHRQEFTGQRFGWLVPAEGDKPARLHFGDGMSQPAPAEHLLTPTDYLAECRALYDRPNAPLAQVELNDRTLTDSELANAAWLYRLGQPRLASRALGWAKNNRTVGVKAALLAEHRSRHAARHYGDMVHAFMVGADEEALDHGQRLLKFYPAEIKADYPQTAAIVVDLQRRQRKGTFGKRPTENLPAGFAAWDADRKVAWLIDSLDEVDSLATDRLVQALIEVGDAAVPALIDVVEKDDRLTRSVHYWREWHPSRTVLGVREAGLSAVMSILRVRVFAATATGESFSDHGQEVRDDVVKRLRSYWNKYGQLTFDERMFTLLRDPQAKFPAVREAATNLSTIHRRQTLATTLFNDVEEPETTGQPNPVIAKFSDPTVAEAILAALDRDLQHHERQRHDQPPSGEDADYQRETIESTYLDALAELGDRRIAGQVAGRFAKAQSLRMRYKWAFVAFRLGQEEPLRKLAHQVSTGTSLLPVAGDSDSEDSPRPELAELAAIVRLFSYAGTPETDKALYCLAEATHPLHEQVRQQVLKQTHFNPFLSHPFCISILRRELDNQQATGGECYIEKNSLIETGDGWSSGGVPSYLANRAQRRERVATRYCDGAARLLADQIWTAPLYHPLLKDADHRLAALKRMVDSQADGFRRLNSQERRVLGNDWPALVVPNLRPLGRPATAADVARGAAVFHLNGQGKFAGIPLPAGATLKPTTPAAQGAVERVLIVQAEVAADGQTWYGIFQQGSVRRIAADQLTDITLIEATN